MKNTNRTPKASELAEATFDICYLTFDLIAGILFLAFSKGQTLFILYGALALTLGIGDAFHLLPRVMRALKGSNQRINTWMLLGLQISSITMTIFYIMLLYIWKLTFPEMEAPKALVALVWISALARIIICLLPQNRWLTEEGNMRLSYVRNSIFLLTGLGIIILYMMSGNTYGYHMTRMVPAIIISFGCYIPVVFYAKKKPMLGMLMIPKTCAYIWMIVMGLQILF